jgi:hypothetical protein
VRFAGTKEGPYRIKQVALATDALVNFDGLDLHQNRSVNG